MVRSLFSVILLACLALAQTGHAQTPEGSGALVDPVGRSQPNDPPRLDATAPAAEPQSLAPPAPEPEEDDWGPADWGKVVGLGVGVGGIVAAVVLGIAYGDQDAKAEKLRKEAIDAAGPDNTCGDKTPLKDTTCKKLGEALQTRDSYGTVAIIAGVGGGLLVIASVVTLAVPIGGDDDDDPEVSFRPTLGGAILEGRF